MTELKIVYRKISDLKPYPGNPRTHSKSQLRQLEASIREYGFITPILVDESDRVVAGHGRLSAAPAAGVTEVPTVCVAHLSPMQVKAYRIADNKIAEKAGWNMEPDLARGLWSIC